MKFNREHMELWLQDLETTTDPQTIGTLTRVAGGFPGDCCLGRGCRVAIANGVDITVSETSSDCLLYDGALTSFPQAVIEWLGLDENMCDEIDDFTDWCVNMNDTEYYDFKEIAGAIRERLGL